MGKVTFFLLCLFAAFIPFETMANFGDLPSGAKLIGMPLVASAALAFLTGHRIRMLPLPLVMRVVLVFLSVISCTWSSFPEATLTNVSRMIQVLILALLVWEFAVTYKEQMWLLRSLLVGMLVPLAMQMVAFRSGGLIAESAEEARFSGAANDLNYLAYMYGIAIMVAVYLATNSLTLDRKCRWFYWGMAALCAIGNILTGSRSGFICLLAASVVSMVMAGVSRGRIVAILQFLALVVVVYWIAMCFIPASVFSRVASTSTSVWEDPRVQIWGRGLAAFLKTPLFGTGSGTFARATVASGSERGAVAHNAFLSVLVELGVIGFTLFLSYVIMLFRTAWRLPRREKLLWLGVLSVWTLWALLTGSEYDHFTWSLHVLVLAQAAACAQLGPPGKLPLYFRRAVSLIRKPVPPRFGRP